MRTKEQQYKIDKTIALLKGSYVLKCFTIIFEETTNNTYIWSAVFNMTEHDLNNILQNRKQIYVDTILNGESVILPGSISGYSLVNPQLYITGLIIK